MYESSIIFQPLFYANVPAESPSYAPTFFSNKDPIIQEVEIVSRMLKWEWKATPKNRFQSYFCIREQLTIAPTEWQYTTIRVQSCHTARPSNSWGSTSTWRTPMTRQNQAAATRQSMVSWNPVELLLPQTIRNHFKWQKYHKHHVSGYLLISVVHFKQESTCTH